MLIAVWLSAPDWGTDTNWQRKRRFQESAVDGRLVDWTSDAAKFDNGYLLDEDKEWQDKTGRMAQGASFILINLAGAP